LKCGLRNSDFFVRQSILPFEPMNTEQGMTEEQTNIEQGMMIVEVWPS
jgi:hypothetical protein